MVEEKTKVLVGNSEIGFSKQYAQEIDKLLTNILIVSNLKEFTVTTKDSTYTFFTRQSITIKNNSSLNQQYMNIVLVIKNGIFDNIHIVSFGFDKLLKELDYLVKEKKKLKHSNSKYFTYDEKNMVEVLNVVEQFIVNI